MRDSVNGHLIPPGTPVVAGYADGIYQWSQAMWDAHPDAIHLSIAVHPEHQADILDVERGDAVPMDVPGWIDRFSRPGRRAPTIYCSRSDIAAVRAATGLRKFDWWAATLDGTTSVPGAVAVQFADYGGYDESVILDPTWVGMSTAPAVQPTPPQTAGDEMTIDQARGYVLLNYYSVAKRVPPQADVEYWAGRMVNEGVETILAVMEGTPEFRADLAKEQAEP